MPYDSEKFELMRIKKALIRKGTITEADIDNERTR